MAKMQTDTVEKSRKKNKKRNRSSDDNGKLGKVPRTLSTEKEKQVPKQNEMPQRTIPWKHLDLILSLENKEISIQRKIELASEFVSSPCNKDSPCLDTVPLPRLVAFLNNWVQSVLINSEKNASKVSETLDLVLEEPCLDYRCWKIFNFCLTESSQSVAPLSFSPNLLRPVSCVLRHVSATLSPTRAAELLALVSDCVHLIFSSHCRSFNANFDLWTLLSNAAINLICSVLNDIPSGDSVDNSLRLPTLVLEPFANYLKIHPSPKNIFPVFVDKLLEPFLTLLNLSDLPANLFKLVEEILSNGLFHPAHIDGFLGIRSSEKYMGSENEKVGSNESKIGGIKSYHKHLFQKVKQFPTEKKTSVGHLFLLFVNRAKKQREISLSFSSNKKHAEKASSQRRLDEETSKLIFDVFVQFMEPMMLDIKRFSSSDVGSDAETILTDAFYCLESVNKMLASFMGARVYIRTEDTIEGAHFNFLKEVYNVVILFSTKINLLWSLALEMHSKSCAEKLLVISKEVIMAVGYFIEIEYKVLENDLVGLWVLMLSYQAVDLAQSNSHGCSTLASEILRLGCRLVNLYSELRQVGSPIYALCTAVRFFSLPTDNGEVGHSKFMLSTPVLSSEVCIGSVTTLICSHEFRLAISTAINSIPEGQVGGSIRQLKMDLIESLEWIKIGHLRTVRKEIGEANTDISFQTELFGKGLSELYALILDSSNVTMGTSVVVGNSVKDLMNAIQPSLSNLVKKASDSVHDFIISVFSNQKMHTSKSCLWVILSFFRLYLSCRSLYRQIISLMPPSSSKKASAAIGDIFTAHSGKDWIDNTPWEDEGYFSWITKPSASLLDVIQSIRNFCLQETVLDCAPLVYVLHAMAIQRLVDLSRQLKAFEFLHGAYAGINLSHKERKKWKRVALLSRQEAVELTSFVTGYVSVMIKKGKSKPMKHDLGSGETILMPLEDDAWDFCISSVSEKSLPTGIWCLLCQNIDVWCACVDERVLKNFLSLFFHHSLFFLSSSRNLREPRTHEPAYSRKLTVQNISLGLLSDPVLYEQTFLYRHLRSRFCRNMKKLLLPLISSDVAFGSLPDWSTILSIMQKASVGLGDNCSDHGDCRASGLDSLQNSLPFLQCDKETSCAELAACQNLLSLLCLMPKGCANSRYLNVYATYILNIESLVVPSLLKYHGELCLDRFNELFKLFVSCRRALRYIIMASVEEEMEGTSLSSTLFRDSFSILWFLKSVSEVVGLPSAFSEVRFSRVREDMIFSLMDHTSHIFFVLSASLVNVAVQSQINEHISSRSCEEKDQTEVDLNSHSSEHSSVFKCIEPMAEILKEQIASVLITLKGTDQNEKLNWNQLSSIVSCVQGFLWGLASASNNIKQEKFSLTKEGNSRELIVYTNIFEEFVSYCLNLLLVNDTPKSGSDSVSMKDKISLEVALISGFDIPEDEFQTSLGEEQASNLTAVSSRIDLTENSNFTNGPHLIDASKHLNRSLLESLMKGEKPDVAFLLRQLFIASAAILQLRYLISFRKSSKPHTRPGLLAAPSTVVLSGTSHFVISKFTEIVGRPDPFSFLCLDGILKYTEILGGYFPFMDPVLSRSVYTKLIDVHLTAIGKCISLQGKAATLASHQMESSTKTLKRGAGLSDGCGLTIEREQYNVDELKAMVRRSFKMFIRKPLELHLLSVVQALERALVGVWDGNTVNYEINTGTIDGGQVSSIVAAGIDCLDLLLESVGGNKRSTVVKRHIQSLICALLNIVLHLQSPAIFWKEKLERVKNGMSPDPGSVILMCVEVVTKVAGKPALFPMEPSHVGQSLHLPTLLFKHFLHLRGSGNTSHLLTLLSRAEIRNSGIMHSCMMDCQFSVALYAANCRLLCAIVRHRKSEYERCIALLEDSVCHLLYCLETVDVDLVSKKGFLAWELQEAIKCASFLRRIYEEIRQQKDVLGKFSFHFLSNYIWVYSGYGPLRTGIRREIDEALRPGLYALIDVCSPADLQQLHTVLGEGPCRSTLATLQHDYKLNFQYEGKV